MNSIRKECWIDLHKTLYTLQDLTMSFFHFLFVFSVNELGSQNLRIWILFGSGSKNTGIQCSPLWDESKDISRIHA